MTNKPQLGGFRVEAEAFNYVRLFNEFSVDAVMCQNDVELSLP